MGDQHVTIQPHGHLEMQQSADGHDVSPAQTGDAAVPESAGKSNVQKVDGSSWVAAIDVQ